jgi:hypothetical protein
VLCCVLEMLNFLVTVAKKRVLNMRSEVTKSSSVGSALDPLYCTVPYSGLSR